MARRRCKRTVCFRDAADLSLSSFIRGKVHQARYYKALDRLLNIRLIGVGRNWCTPCRFEQRVDASRKMCQQPTVRKGGLYPLLLFLSKSYQDRITHFSLAFFVRGVIDYTTVEEHCGRAAAIEVHRVGCPKAQKVFRQVLQTDASARFRPAVDRDHQKLSVP